MAGKIGVESLCRKIEVYIPKNQFRTLRLGLVEKIISLADLSPVLSGKDCNFQLTPTSLQTGANEPFEDFLQMMETRFLSNNKTATKLFCSLLDWNITFQEFAMKLDFDMKMYNQSYLNFLAYFHTDSRTASDISRRFIVSLMSAPSPLPNLNSTVPAAGPGQGAYDRTDLEALQSETVTRPSNVILQESNELGN